MPVVAGAFSSVACIAAIGSLASQKTARLGNFLGMAGVGIAVAATLGSLWTNHPGLDTLVEFGEIGGLAALGGVVGLSLASKVSRSNIYFKLLRVVTFFLLN